MKSPEPASMHPATLCIHAGHRASADQRAVVAPVVHSTTFLLDDEAYAAMTSGRSSEALIYTRIRNPTLDVVQERIAALEGADRSLLFASGMAAIHAGLMASLRSGSRVVAHREIYGSTWDLLSNLLAPLGIVAEFVDLNDDDSRRAALSRGADVVYLETITNPSLDVPALPRIAADARAAGAQVLVDATFATPLLQRPLSLGADLSIHSATKYMGGHSDLIGGCVSGGAAVMARVYRWMQLAGGCMDPHAAFLLDRGLKTLPLRMECHQRNALHLARRLERHPRVEAVLYPGLASHRAHERARRTLSGFGGMLSIVVRGGDEAALRMVRRLKLALEASSLGGVETLVSLPYNTSHTRMTAAERLAAGIPPGLVRISVGVEDVRDLEADFVAALDGA
ncbi:MAG: aminotransferase class I/II-fold pyridoxal phosphate-dependent enzyme [Planctomycetota bacterium]|nr:aminotransferase class I/II-fold pyridoxal phosphate-dependent enzyme [Planctomycetota bacterium]